MSLSRRPRTVLPITIREVSVAAVEDLGPGMRRLVLAGEQMGSFIRQGHPMPAVASVGFDDDIKFIVPRRGQERPPLPPQMPRHVVWEREHMDQARTYTVRAFDESTGRMTVDVVTHDGGLASHWAAQLCVGDPVWFAGPKGSADYPVTDWTLLVGDETALPAIARWMDEAPPGSRAQVFIELTDPSHRLSLPSRDGVEVTWVLRSPEQPTALLDTIRSCTWWPGRAYAWIAGESTLIAPIRRHLKNDRGMPVDDLEMTGYWRRAASRIDQDSTGTPVPSGAGATSHTVAPARALDSLTDLAASLSIRAAIAIGLVDELLTAPAASATIAHRLGADPQALRRLMGYLAAIGILRRQGDLWELTPLGLELDDEAMRAHTAMDSIEGLGQLSLVDLASRIVPRQDESRLVDVSARRRACPQAEEDHHRHHGGYLRLVAADLAQIPELTEASQVLIHGYGAAAVAPVLVTGEHGHSTVVVSSACATWSRDQHDTVRGSARERIALHEIDLPTTRDVSLAWSSNSVSFPGASAVVLLGVLSELPEGDAAELIAAVAEHVGPGGVVAVLDHHVDEDCADLHEMVDDLAALSAYDAGYHSMGQVFAWMREAGLDAHREIPVGWGGALCLGTVPEQPSPR